MRSCFLLSLAVAVLVGLSATQSLARGGGRGGARPGGGRPGGGDVQGGGARSGELGSRAGAVDRESAKSGQRDAEGAQNKVSQYKRNVNGKNQPFTPAWYANHPRAWQSTHPHADAWAVATFGTAAAWLGITAASNGGYVDDTTTVYTSDTEDNTDDQSSSDQENSPAQLANNGGLTLPADENFLSLGVFSLAPQDKIDASALVQLAVNKNGEVRGSYYDLLTDQEQTIQGALDKRTQRVTFTVGNSGPVAFETVLRDLTQASGKVTLRFENGTTKQWTLARYENQPQATK